MIRVIFLLLAWSLPLTGATTTPSTSSKSQATEVEAAAPSGISLPKPTQPPVAPIPSPQPVQVNESSVYTHPGIVVAQGGKWVGSDHLLNLSKKVEIIVEIIKPEGLKLPFDESSIKASIEALFKKHDFNPDFFSAPQDASQLPGIPFFDVLLVIYPIDQGFVALIEGRLMESVDPLRVRLERDSYFQAITWEKKTLIVAPTEEFKDTVNKTIDEITSVFFERYTFFEKVRLQMDSKTGFDRYR